jgi:hypothetical protein
MDNASRKDLIRVSLCSSPGVEGYLVIAAYGACSRGYFFADAFRVLLLIYSPTLWVICLNCSLC